MMKTYVSARAFSSQRKSGFKNTSYALAELVDNAFDAEADEVRIIFLEKNINGRPRVDKIIVADNGKGMNKELLEDCLILGESGVTEMQEILRTKRIGKFGYGLPNASISQCKVTEVYSWVPGGNKFFQHLDLDGIKNSQSIEVPPAVEKALPAYIQSMLGTREMASGTVIVWNDCDLISYARASTLINHSEKILGRIYRYLINDKKKKIILSAFSYNETDRKYTAQDKDIVVRPEDPLFLMSNTTAAEVLFAAANSGEISAPFFKPYSVSEKENKPTSYKLDEHCAVHTFKYLDQVYRFKLTTSVAFPAIQKPGIRNGGDTKVGNLYRQKETLGNIYFVRAGREVDVGSFGDFYRRAQPNHRFWTIEVEFEPDMDELLGVLNNKQHVAFHQVREAEIYDENYASPVEAQNALFFKLSQEITTASKAAISRINKQAAEFDNINKPGIDAPTIPVGTPTTTTTVLISEGQRTQSLPKEEKDQLVEKLHKTYPQLELVDIEKSVISLDESAARACIIYVPSVSEQLWNYTKIWDFHVIEINTNHLFYKKIIAPLQQYNDDGSLTAIELFIIASVIEEENTIQNDAKKRAIENHRLSVAIKLKEFMNDLTDSFSIKHTEVDDSDDD